MSDKYKIVNPYGAYFLTLTVVGWIYVFKRKNHKLTIVESLTYSQQNKGLAIFGWCFSKYYNVTWDTYQNTIPYYIKSSIMKSTFMVLFLFSMVSCGPLADHKYTITVQNNANYDIEVFAYALYPDTLLTPTKPFFVYVYAHDNNTINESGKWETVFPELPRDTLSIYVFRADTLNRYTWGEIRSGYKIMKRYDLSLDDLLKSNWTITYP